MQVEKASATWHGPGVTGATLTHCVIISLLIVCKGRYAEPVPGTTAAASRARACQLLTSRLALAAIEKLVQDADPEAQRLDRHPLVDAVEHAREIQVGGEPERGEAEAPDAQPAEGFRVSAAGQAVRHDPGARVLGQQCPGHRRAKVAVECRLQRDVVVDELALDARAEQLVHLGEEFLLVAGQEPPVHVRHGGLGGGEGRFVVSPPPAGGGGVGVWGGAPPPGGGWVSVGGPPLGGGGGEKK